MPKDEIKLKADLRVRLTDWLNAFKADPFSTGSDKVDRLLELVSESRPPLTNEGELVEVVLRDVSELPGDDYDENDPDLLRVSVGDLRIILERAVEATSRAALEAASLVKGER